MIKTTIDTTQAKSAYIPPSDASAALFARLQAEARLTYPDHINSQRDMIEQRLLQEVDEREKELAKLRTAVKDVTRSLAEVNVKLLNINL
jgi:hypothetical protein